MLPDDAIRSRLLRNSTGIVELAPRPDHIPDASREVDVKLPYQPALPQGFADADEGQLSRAHSGALERAREIRRIADQAWRDEPRIQNVALTQAQRWAWKREHVKAVVAAEVEKASALLKPIVERSKADLLKRREKLTTKGQPKLTGTDAQRAMQLVDHFARLEPEVRSLRIIEALNASDADSKELLAAVAWSNANLDLVSPETRARIQGALVAMSDPAEYAALTDYDLAVQATSESLDNLERWGASLAEEM